MRCPFCGYEDTRVIESRTIQDGLVVRRRRECPKCGSRFTTYERYELGPAWVVKKDGRREKFSREKILKGIMKACEKRPVSYEDMEKIVDRVISYLQKNAGKEVESVFIGGIVMDELKKVDQVAYVRFASVYKDFREIDQFLDIIHELKGGEGK
ncbi:MAG: transcriptional repressor NrdR [Thermotogaceae bacterium]|nr:transcriptional repressor NrdR [Thermotogaceae bacterium]